MDGVDEFWVCGGCRSVNRSGAPRCYSCHGRRTDLAQAAEDAADAPEPTGADPAGTGAGAAGAGAAAAGAGAGTAGGSDTTPPPGPERDRRSPLWLLLAVVAAAATLVGVIAFVGPSMTADRGATGTDRGAAGQTGSPETPTAPLPTPRGSDTPAASPAPNSAGRVRDGAVGGTWLVRIERVPSGTVNLTGQASFQDRVVDIRPGCSKEPCPSITIRVFFLRDPRPVYEASLERSGDSYVSSPQPAGSAACLTASGSRIPSGATVTRTISVWRERTTTPGTAVTIERVSGEVRYEATPSEIGETAGCEPWTATYAISAKTPWSVPTTPGARSSDTPPDGSALVALPALSFPVEGARVTYFPVTGSTVAALAESIMHGGVRACGEIEYEWVEDDARPAGCMQMIWNDEMIAPRIDASTGSCRLTVTRSRPTYLVHLPRWTEPDRVPGPLLGWWRKVLAFIGEHEARHVQLYQQYVSKLPAQLAGAPCESGASSLDAWARELSAAHEAFDRSEYEKPYPRPPRGY